MKERMEEKEHLLKARDVADWPEDEKKEALKAIDHRDRLLAWVKRYKGYNDQALYEVALEAEHQEGVEYWWQFSTPEELAADLRLYFANV